MSKRLLPWYILLLIVLLCAAIVLSTKEGFKTNATDFENDLSNKPQLLALFYSTNCGYCKDLQPEWDSASKGLSEDATTSVDCTSTAGGTTDPAVSELMKKYNITGFPTMIYFNNGVMQETYDGPRKSADIIEYVQKKKSIVPATTSANGIEKKDNLLGIKNFGF